MKHSTALIVLVVLLSGCAAVTEGLLNTENAAVHAGVKAIDKLCYAYQVSTTLEKARLRMRFKIEQATGGAQVAVWCPAIDPESAKFW